MRNFTRICLFVQWVCLGLNVGAFIATPKIYYLFLAGANVAFILMCRSLLEADSKKTSK